MSRMSGDQQNQQQIDPRSKTMHGRLHTMDDSKLIDRQYLKSSNAAEITNSNQLPLSESQDIVLSGDFR